MRELKDSVVEDLVRQHLSAELDGQLGRCESAFLQHAARPQYPRGQGRGLRLFTMVGTAVAAGIAGLLIAPAIFGPSATPAPSGPGIVARHVTPVANEPMIHMVQSRTYDEGTVIMEDSVPARKLRRVRIERTGRYDPREGVQWERSVPHEDITYMEMDTY